MKSSRAGLLLALLCAVGASALTPAAESMLRTLGQDPESELIRAIAADTVRTKAGVYTLDSLAAKGDLNAVKSFLVTRDFLRAFKDDPDIEFPDDASYDIRYLTEAEKVYIARKLMEGIPAAGKR